jgi:hypothetical protein
MSDLPMKTDVRGSAQNVRFVPIVLI